MTNDETAGSADAKALYRDGADLCKAGRYTEALILLRPSEKHPAHFKTFELIGECLLRTGAVVVAVPFLAAATALNQGVRGPALLAESFLALEDFERAREFAELALAREPNNRMAKSVIAKLLEEQGGASACS